MSDAEVEEAELLAVYRALPAPTRTLVRAAVAGMLNATEKQI